MSNTKNLEIKGSLHITTLDAIELTINKVNNFADKVTVTVSDESANTDDSTITGLRDYSTGKEPTNPVLSFSPAGLANDEVWTLNISFASTDDSELLAFTFKVYMEGSKAASFVFEPSLKVTKTL